MSRRLFPFFMICTLLAVVLALTSAVVDAQGSGVIRRYHLNYSGVQDINRAANATMAIWFDDRVQAAYITETGGYSFTVNGNPEREYDGTWPGSLPTANYYYQFDGAGDDLRITNAASSGAFNPAGSFSAYSVATFDSVAAGLDVIQGVWNTANQRSWVVYRSADDIIFEVSDDGTGGAAHMGTVTLSSCLTAGSTAYITATYQYVADGSSVATIYVDTYTKATDGTFDGPPHASTGDYRIGIDGAGASWLAGFVHYASFHDATVLTEAQHNQFRNGQLNPRSLNPTMWTDFRSDPAGTFITEGGTYTLTVTGAPERAKDIYTTQGRGWQFDNAGDYLARASDGTFNPAGDFSIRAVVTPDTVTGTDGVFAKTETAGNLRGWTFVRATTGYYFELSNDGTATTGLTKTNVADIGKTNFITVSYNYVTSGTSEVRIYVDNEATASKDTYVGPTYATTAPTEIGAQDGAASQYWGRIHHIAFYDGAVITEAQHDQAYLQWKGMLASDGSQSVTTASATPPAIWTSPGEISRSFLQDQPANSTQVGSPARGSGGLYGAAAITNLIHRSTFETCTQNGNTEPDGWTVTETPNAGTAAVYCSTADSAHRRTGLRMDTTVDGLTEIASNCLTTGIGNDMAVELWAKKLSGTSHLDVKFKEFNNPACAGPLGSYTGIGAIDVTTTWQKVEGTIGSGDWNVATAGYVIEIYQDTSAATVLIDAVQLRDGTLVSTDAYCGADTDASAVCNLDWYTINTPMAPATWQIDMTLRTAYDWTIAANHFFMYTNATAATNNIIHWRIDIDTIKSAVFNSGGAGKYSNINAAGLPNIDYDISLSHTAGGSIVTCWDGNCDATPGTDAITDGIKDVTYFNNTGSGRTWYRDIVFKRRISQ